MVQIETELIEFKSDDGKIFEAFVARDVSQAGQRPCVLIFHTFGGRSDSENEKAKKLAEFGYVGFACDVYGKGVGGSNPEENSKLMKPLKDDRNGALLPRLKLNFETARKLSYVDPKKVAAIGYCFGGLCALDLARNVVDPTLSPVGVVSLHGLLVKPDDQSTAKIHSKVLVLHGWSDGHVPPEQVLAFCQEMTDRKADWQLHAYGHAMHAFTNPKANDLARSVKYDANADRRSWEATRYFLHECFV